MPDHDLKPFLDAWDLQAARVLDVMRALPETAYAFRPDPDGRSLGELAWHLAELEGFIALFIDRDGDLRGERPPGLERPRTIAELAPGYARVHAEARERATRWTPARLDGTLTFFDGRPHPVRELLWDATLHHSIHHLGQLVLMCRQAGGQPPGVYGANREQTAVSRARRSGPPPARS